MADEIQVLLMCDASDFTAGMTQSREQLEQNVVSIQRQETTWLSFTATAVGAIGRVAGPIISLVSAQKRLAAATIEAGTANAVATPPTLTFAAAVNFLLSPIVLTLAAITLLAGAIYLFANAGEEASATTKKVGETASETASSMSALEKIQEAFQAGMVGTEGLDALNALDGASKELQDAFGELGNAMLQPLIDAGFEVGSLTDTFTHFATVVKGITSYVQSITSSIKLLTDAAASWRSLGGMEAEQAASIEAFQAKKAQIFAEKELSQLMANATEEAQKRGDIQRISSITSLDALDAETAALKEQIAQLKQKRMYGEGAQKEAEERAKAIANQREGIESGRVKEKKSPVDAMIENAQRGARELEQGAIGAALAQARLNGATEQQVDLLRQELEHLADLKADQKSREDMQKRIAENIDKEIKKQEEAENKILSMRDKIDLLSGSATKAEVAVREMMRNGFSREAAEEIAALQDEIDELEKNKKSKDGGKTTPKAVFAGSQEAASIMLRGLGVGDKTLEQNVVKQTAIQQQMLIAIKDNRPPEIQASNLGVA